MSHMLLAKRICLLTLSFFIVVSPFANLCFATSSPFPAGDQASNLGDQGHSHHDHGQPSQNHKTLCHKGLLCCQAIMKGTLSYSFVLDSRSAASAQIFSHPFEITELIYHPPETLL